MFGAVRGHVFQQQIAEARKVCRLRAESMVNETANPSQADAQRSRQPRGQPNHRMKGETITSTRTAEDAGMAKPHGLRPGVAPPHGRRMAIGRGSMACLAAALIVVFASHLFARQQVGVSEHRALAARGRATELVNNQMVSRVDTMLASLHSVASVTNGDPEAFERAAGPGVQSEIFASISLVKPNGDLVLTVGKPNLASPLSPTQQARLQETASQPGMMWVDRTGSGALPNLGFA